MLFVFIRGFWVICVAGSGRESVLIFIKRREYLLHPRASVK